ncbi:dihydrolipoyllysine-residue acetyltransferase [Caldimonas thermodepolymerans]|uniref:dihydrolipoyllysine-residue acetyltransferase n=1 Tax=Caldimonas thermodepolymerans TaxID=215580 RepID=UPI00248F9981|nr:dihydrolipoyllysine-residue acetyltransferase [Caldimonas thermodepolymerans]
MALVEVKVPDIGDFKDVEIIEVLVQPGDTIKAEQSLVTVESDKASMEIPSSHAGVVKELKVKLGDKVSEGSLLLLLEAADAAAAAPAPAAAAPAAEPAPAPAPAAAAAPAPAAAGGTVEVVVPDIGDFKDVAVIEVLVQPGDRVQAEQSLITVESDKASMEIPSSHAGVVKELKVKVGDKVSQGSLIAVVEAEGAAAPAPAAAAPQPAQPPAAAAGPAELASQPVARTSPTAALPAHEPTAPRGKLPHASPSIRKLARELGVPLEEVPGTGPKGRITQEDVQNFVKKVMAGDVQTQAQKGKGAGTAGGALPGLLPWPQVDFAKFGPVERKDLSRIKKISGANLHRNWVMIPHVTNHEDADITELEAFRVSLNKEYEKAGVKVTMLAFLIKACVAALKKFPEFNASLDGDTLVLKKYYHIGFAADTPNGLVVPVIKDADKKGVLEIAKETAELAAKAREGKLSPAEMSGGCFSISSLGGIGGTYFTPIINAPEVAILGVCRSAMKPVWDGKQFQPRLILPLSLSWDHRVIDGAAAARFNTYLANVLADFRRVLL